MPVSITESDVDAAAARLRGDGWWFSARQLYYATCAQVERPPAPVAQSEVGLGVLLVLVGAVTGNRIALLVLGSLGLLFIVAGIATRRGERRPRPLIRPLAIAFHDFERRFCDEPGRRQGLLPPSAPISSQRAGTIVLCDRPETAAVLVANAARLEGAGVATAAAYRPMADAEHVVVLHDCDPSGCALAGQLRATGAVVADAGINPGELTGRPLQCVEGAPARVSDTVAAELGPDAAEWLRSGRRLECATESPEQLVQRVLAAIRNQPAQPAAGS